MRTKSRRRLPTLSLRGHTCKADGKGLWSDKSKTVALSKAVLDIVQLNNKGMWGELVVYFKKSSWNVETDALIYTDRAFLKDLRAIFTKSGFCDKAIKELDYSEQGLQTDDYVSLDAGRHFCEHFLFDALDLGGHCFCGG